jgi:hypothetical protein
MVWFEVDATGEQYRDKAFRSLIEEDVLQMIIKDHGTLISAEWLSISGFGDAAESKYRFCGTYKERRYVVQ